MNNKVSLNNDSNGEIEYALETSRNYNLAVLLETILSLIFAYIVYKLLIFIQNFGVVLISIMQLKIQRKRQQICT